MNELERMQYLEVLGVDTFVPRVLLPGAKASVACRLPEVFELDEHTANVAAPIGSTAEPSRRESAGGASDIIANVVSDLGRSSTSAGRRREAIVEPATSIPAAASSLDCNDATEHDQENIHFHILLWQPAPSLKVFSSYEPGAALPIDRLLCNILRYSPWAVQQLPAAELQTWPVPGGDSRQKGWSAAKAMMSAFLDGRLVVEPAEQFWVFGETAYRATNGESVDQEAPFNDVCFSRIRLPAYSVDALILPSLAEILASPQTKAKLWALISPLAKK